MPMRTSTFVLRSIGLDLRFTELPGGYSALEQNVDFVITSVFEFW